MFNLKFEIKVEWNLISLGTAQHYLNGFLDKI